MGHRRTARESLIQLKEIFTRIRQTLTNLLVVLRERLNRSQMYIVHGIQTLAAFRPDNDTPQGGWSVLDGDGNVMLEEWAALQPYEDWVCEKATMLLGYEPPRRRRHVHLCC
eukprot:Protomagalhaensia_wolfi_Nauph_80__4976@NODE_5256_length_418_cov_2_875989_g4310_i0_p1_GENE_NODE_5256_length_418_cov_2_875989_g4310_i0NODE_5256_length_418_cov_2_875989_g4310_i0_p1_ORF_typecomplete_len112_score11_45_NODE_5256_length_418_cov_2_875989_g4310_i030365